MNAKRIRGTALGWKVLKEKHGQQFGELLPPAIAVGLIQRILRRHCFRQDQWPRRNFCDRSEAEPHRDKSRTTRHEKAVLAWFGDGIEDEETYNYPSFQSRQSIAEILGDQNPVSRKMLAATIWQALHQPLYCNNFRPSSPRERELLRSSFLDALANCVREDLRLCPYSVTQNLLSVLQGYYPYSIDGVCPELLLAELCKHYFGHFDNLEDVSDAYVHQCADEMLDIAKSRFLLHSEKTSEDYELFCQHLTQYVAYTFGGATAEANAFLATPAQLNAP